MNLSFGSIVHKILIRNTTQICLDINEVFRRKNKMWQDIVEKG